MPDTPRPSFNRSWPPRVREIMKDLWPDTPLAVEFTKRGNGEFRRMRCITHSQNVQSRKYTFDPVEKKLVAVWDQEKGEPRFVAADAVHEIMNLDTGEIMEGADLERGAMGQGLSQSRQEFQNLHEEMQRLF